jgi:hypothetical protein
VGGQDVDAFVEVSVSGGLRDPGVASEAVDAAGLAEPAQYEHSLTEGAQCTGSPRRADPAAVSGEQTGEVLHDVAGDVEHGNIGDQREASGDWTILW